MHRFGTLACLWVLAASAQAANAPAYVINGLHVGLDFDEAVAAAEALGGTCEVESLRRGEKLFAGCAFSTCAQQSGESACKEQPTDRPVLGTGKQPIVRIGLEAAGASGRLSKISIVFDGSSEVVAAALKREFGEPFSDTSGHTGQSWSHSRRVHWKSGGESMGLLKDINTITLFADRVNEPPGSQPADTR